MMMKVEIKIARRRMSIQFYDNGAELSTIVATLNGDAVSVHAIKSIKIGYYLTVQEVREYAGLLSLLAETAEMVTKKITGPEDFDKNWTARLVDNVVILEEANETP